MEHQQLLDLILENRANLAEFKQAINEIHQSYKNWTLGGVVAVLAAAILASVCQKTPFSVDFPTEFQTASGFQLFPKPECLTTPLNHPLSPIFGQTSPLALYQTAYPLRCKAA